ncbi:MAG: YggS family pyridoxal phosphate-dependent enzyme [Clostridia bacterium]|nr:YggS family pyridoxal phosphate-dependent enzyme [Clostridia bacterium]
MIKENVEKFLGEVPKTNPFGEKITVVAAVKMQTVEAINEAVLAGIEVIGDNHVQEFKEKYEDILGNPKRHFIGHLQTNKVKYLIGKTDLYHSVDRFGLAEELSKRSQKAEITSNILIQINIGNEESKGGFELDEVITAYEHVKNLPNLKVKGLMAMLPFIDDEVELKRLATLMRQAFDELKALDSDIEYLSMGMSGDWKLCVECGSNMIRVGTTLFGARNYN